MGSSQAPRSCSSASSSPSTTILVGCSTLTLLSVADHLTVVWCRVWRVSCYACVVSCRVVRVQKSIRCTPVGVWWKSSPTGSTRLSTPPTPRASTLSFRLATSSISKVRLYNNKSPQQRLSGLLTSQCCAPGRRDFEGDTKVIACISVERDDVPHGTALLLLLPPHLDDQEA